jgi:hypothetical protein
VLVEQLAIVEALGLGEPVVLLGVLARGGAVVDEPLRVLEQVRLDGGEVDALGGGGRLVLARGAVVAAGGEQRE